MSTQGYPNLEPSEKSQLSFRAKPVVSSMLRPTTSTLESGRIAEEPKSPEQPQNLEARNLDNPPSDERAKYATLGRETHLQGDNVYGPYKYAPTDDRSSPPARYLVQSDGGHNPAGSRSSSPSILNKFAATRDTQPTDEKPPAGGGLAAPAREQEVFLSKDSYVSVSDRQHQSGQLHKPLDHSDPFPFTLEFKPIADPPPTLEVSPVSEAGYFSFSPLKEALEGPPARVVNSLHSQQSGLSGFENFYDVPRLLLAIEIERLQFVQIQAQPDREDLKEAVQALDFKDEEIRRLQRLLDDEKLNHKQTVEDLMSQAKDKNKSIENLSEGIKNLQMRVKEIERSRSQSPITQKVTTEEEQSQLASKITLAISGCLVPFFEQLKSQSHRQSDEKSVKMCAETIKQLENLQTIPIATWKNDSRRALTTLGISLDSVNRSLEERNLAQQKSQQRLPADERPYLSTQSPQSARQEGSQRSESMERSVLIEEKIEMIDGQPTKVKYIKREPVRTRDNSWAQQSSDRELLRDSRYLPSKSPEPSAMGLALTQRLIEENCRIAEEFNKVKVQNKQLKDKVAVLESKYQSEAGSTSTTAPGSMVGSVKRFDGAPYQPIQPGTGYYRPHDDLY